MPRRSTLFQDPLVDYYGLNPEDDPADTPLYSVSVLFDSYEDEEEDEIDDLVFA